MEIEIFAIDMVVLPGATVSNEIIAIATWR
jgi:hypothetical protein